MPGIAAGPARATAQTKLMRHGTAHGTDAATDQCAGGWPAASHCRYAGTRAGA